MTCQENYLDLFDFQGTDQEKEELKLYLTELAKLPTGKKILKQVRECSVRKPIPVKYGDIPEKWNAQWYNDTESIIYCQKHKLSTISATPKDDQYWQCLMQHVSTFGHELTHGLIHTFREIDPKDLTICQKVYRSLWHEALAHSNSGFLNYEFTMSHFDTIATINPKAAKVIKNWEPPTAEKYKKFFVRFITDSIEKGTFDDDTPPLYVDEMIERNGVARQPVRLISNTEFMKPLSKVPSLVLGMDIDLPAIENCRWYVPTAYGEGYSIVGRKRMMGFYSEEHPYPLYSVFYDGENFKNRLYSRKYKVENGGIIPDPQCMVTLSRPLLEEEAKIYERDVGKGHIGILKMDLQKFDNFRDFVKWQNDAIRNVAPNSLVKILSEKVRRELTESSQPKLIAYHKGKTVSNNKTNQPHTI